MTNDIPQIPLDHNSTWLDRYRPTYRYPVRTQICRRPPPQLGHMLMQVFATVGIVPSSAITTRSGSPRACIFGGAHTNTPSTDPPTLIHRACLRLRSSYKLMLIRPQSGSTEFTYRQNLPRSSKLFFRVAPLFDSTVRTSLTARIQCS